MLGKEHGAQGLNRLGMAYEIDRALPDGECRPLELGDELLAWTTLCP